MQSTLGFNGNGKKSDLRKTLSIPRNIEEAKAAVRDKIEVPETKEASVAKKAESSEGPAAEVSKEKVGWALEEIIQGYKQSHRNMEIAVFKQSFELRGCQVHFSLHGELQQDIFEKCKPEINRLLKQKLKHPEVEVTCEVKQEEESGKNLYTSTDKLNYLLEKSPAMKELQKRFGLETDF